MSLLHIPFLPSFLHVFISFLLSFLYIFTSCLNSSSFLYVLPLRPSFLHALPSFASFLPSHPPFLYVLPFFSPTPSTSGILRSASSKCVPAPLRCPSFRPPPSYVYIVSSPVGASASKHAPSVACNVYAYIQHIYNVHIHTVLTYYTCASTYIIHYAHGVGRALSPKMCEPCACGRVTSYQRRCVYNNGNQQNRRLCDTIGVINMCVINVVLYSAGNTCIIQHYAR